MKNKIKFGIIGGGIIGLAVAYELKQEYKDNCEIIIFEKENKVCMHQSSHNSGVIHAGIYYKPNSERAILCVQGAKLMYDFINKYNIKHKRIGKLIIATNLNEMNKLNELYKNSIINNVLDVKLITNIQELRELEPNVNAIGGIYSPNTGIVNYNDVGEKLYELLQNEMNVRIETNFEVCDTKMMENGDTILISTNNKSIQVNNIIMCGGMNSGGKLEPIIIPVRGRYLKLREQYKNRITRNIYPVPDSRFPFLGVHATPTLSGDILLGPNAMLSLTRENYDQIISLNTKDLKSIIQSKALRKFCLRYFNYGLSELYRDISINKMVKSLQPMLPWLKRNMVERSLQHTGIRATAFSNDGYIIEDFLYEKIPKRNILLIRNAPSPAATSSFSIGKRITKLALKYFH